MKNASMFVLTVVVGAASCASDGAETSGDSTVAGGGADAAGGSRDAGLQPDPDARTDTGMPESGTPKTDAGAGAGDPYSLVLRMVAPRATNPALPETPAHLTTFDPLGTHIGKLFVFFPGTGGPPAGYRYILQTAAGLGYHAIGLAYVNDKSVNFDYCVGNPPPNCQEIVRREIIEGKDHSPLLQVDRANSIEGRLISLLEHLHQQYPTERWNRYLENGGLRTVPHRRCRFRRTLAGRVAGRGSRRDDGPALRGPSRVALFVHRTFRVDDQAPPHSGRPVLGIRTHAGNELYRADAWLEEPPDPGLSRQRR